MTWYIPARGEGDAPGEYGQLPSELDEDQEAEFHDVDADDLDIYLIDEKDSSYEDLNIMTYGPDDSLPIYFFDPEVLKNCEWAEIVSGRKWLEVQWYTAQDMIDLVRAVEYPKAK